MYDHPYITDDNYSTTVLAWYDGGLHFFSSVPAGSEGFELFNVFHLAYAMIFALALYFCHLWWKRGSFRVRKRQVLDSILVAVAAALIGGRLGEAIFYQPAYFFSEPTRLITNASGFTVHGMIIGVILAFWAWARWIKRPVFHLLDQACMFVAIGTPLGRIANFMAGDLWGRETEMPWGVRFPMRGPLFRRVYANGEGETFMRVREELPDGEVAWHLEEWEPGQGYEVLQGGGYSRYPVEAPDSNVFEIVQLVVTTPRHPSQLYQAAAEGIVLLIILALVRTKAKTVGVVSAWFLVCYGILRMLTEFFREPEPGLGYLAGLTRGQLLSLSMVVGGLVLFAWIRRHPKAIGDIASDAPGVEPQVENGTPPKQEPTPEA